MPLRKSESSPVIQMLPHLNLPSISIGHSHISEDKPGAASPHGDRGKGSAAYAKSRQTLLSGALQNAHTARQRRGSAHQPPNIKPLQTVPSEGSFGAMSPHLSDAVSKRQFWRGGNFSTSFKSSKSDSSGNNQSTSPSSSEVDHDFWGVPGAKEKAGELRDGKAGEQRTKYGRRVSVCGTVHPEGEEFVSFEKVAAIMSFLMFALTAVHVLLFSWSNRV
mmetsp:Transcript_49352/g.77111  ORF Transcript_49352/g.77111 Transcript_49352/m.77111 type:complete len:219 (+) Transcript_49352:275-931(+)